MAREKLNIKITRDWARNQAKNEPESGFTSVGGLACRIEELSGSIKGIASDKLAAVQTVDFNNRQSLGKLIELKRRQLRMSVEQLADKANLDLSDLLAIEKAEEVEAAPRTLYQLAGVLGIPVDPLLELAGLIKSKNSGLTESAVRFSARSEPMSALSKEEEEALNCFVKELTKSF